MPSIKGKRIVVIGGGGWLGSASVEAALAASANVALLSRRAELVDGAEVILGSVTDADVVRRALDGQRAL